MKNIFRHFEHREKSSNLLDFSSFFVEMTNYPYDRNDELSKGILFTLNTLRYYITTGPSPLEIITT